MEAVEVRVRHITRKLSENMSDLLSYPSPMTRVKACVATGFSARDPANFLGTPHQCSASLDIPTISWLLKGVGLVWVA